MALGKATRLVDMITDKEKTYEAVMRLGVVTDTQDMSGTVLSEVPEFQVAEEELRAVTESFAGDYMQVSAADVFGTEGQWKEALRARQRR